MINIAIDGFTGSGKSTLAKALETRLGDGFKVLDTGAIFRGLGFVYDKYGYGEMTLENIEKFLKNVDVEVFFAEDGQHVKVNGEDVTPFLRMENVGQLASKISVFPQVRGAYLKIARDFAKKNNCIMEGRDIGSVVMPNADVKIFLTADANIRAQRRYKELLSKKVKTSYRKVLKDLKERDLRDSTREVAPLMPMEDSIIVDNSDYTFEETVEICLNIINKKLQNNKKINIAIDGYVCSGKSTITKLLAKKLGFRIFDTGAIYRGVACAFCYMKYDESKISDKYVCEFSKQINLKVDFLDGVEHVFVNGIDYTAFLRTEKISALSAKISPFGCIRDKVLKLQRGFAKNNDVVMEGRDIGSYVLPNADFKFFCTADENVRAKRRYEQQRAFGNEVSFDDVLRELRERDYNDIHREHGAIKILPESIIVDTTNQNLEESVEFCLNEIRKKYPNIKIKEWRTWKLFFFFLIFNKHPGSLCLNYQKKVKKG